MKRLLMIALGAFLVSTPLLAQDAAASGKKMTANGTVSSISATALTVKGKSGEWTFAVNKGTHVTVSGATRKTAAAKENKEPLQITKYVKVGDLVAVRYHDLGAARHAAEVLVRSSQPATK